MKFVTMHRVKNVKFCSKVFNSQWFTHIWRIFVLGYILSVYILNYLLHYIWTILILVSVEHFLCEELIDIMLVKKTHILY